VQRAVEAIQQLSLRFQVGLGVVIGMVLLFGLLGVVIFTATRQSIELTEQERVKLAETAAASVDAQILHAQDQLEALAGKPAFRRAASLAERAQTVEAAYPIMATYDEIALVDEQGREQWAHPYSLEELGLEPSGTPSWEVALETGESSLGIAGVTAFQHPPVVTVAVPFANAGNNPGVLLGIIHLAHGWQTPVISLPAGGETFVAAVIEERGYILAQAGEATATETNEEPVKIDPHAEMLRPLLLNTSSGVKVHGNDHEEHLVAFAPLEHLQAGVVVEEREDLALAVPNQLQNTLLLFGLVALAVTSTGAWLHVRYVTRPLEELERATRHIAAGALDHPCDVARGDEIGSLAHSFEAMRKQLLQATRERDRWEQQLEERVRERTEEVRQLLEKTIAAQEEERRRLARELHDDTAQAIATLVVNIGAVRESLPPKQIETREMLDEIIDHGSAILSEMRRVMADLRPAALDDLGLIPALRAYAEERLGGEDVELDFQIVGVPRRLDPAIETALFRILQEAVANVVKHSRADQATISIEFRLGKVVGIVQDNGEGFDNDEFTNNHDGIGLQGMRERAELIRGRLFIVSQPGDGTEVRIEVPVEEHDG
jgi:signal transduction histidine kinase